jgi:gas vesicle protein
MGAEWLGGGIVGALVALVAALLALPKIRAEARKLNAEAGAIEWGALKSEVERLTETVKVQGQRIAELEQSAATRADREAELEKENKQLRTEVGRLKSRVKALEAIFKVGPVTPEMQAALDKLDKIP